MLEVSLSEECRWQVPRVERRRVVHAGASLVGARGAAAACACRRAAPPPRPRPHRLPGTASYRYCRTRVLSRAGTAAVRARHRAVPQLWMQPHRLQVLPHAGSASRGYCLTWVLPHMGTAAARNSVLLSSQYFRIQLLLPSNSSLAFKYLLTHPGTFVKHCIIQVLFQANRCVFRWVFRQSFTARYCCIQVLVLFCYYILVLLSLGTYASRHFCHQVFTFLYFYASRYCCCQVNR
jgi:hypothetical protein